MDPATDDAQTVITLDGQEISISRFRSGERSDLYAIKKPGTLRTSWSVIHPVPNPNDLLPTSVKPCSIPDPDPCIVNPMFGPPALFAAFYIIDPNNLLLEFNEDDNILRSNTIR